MRLPPHYVRCSTPRYARCLTEANRVSAYPTLVAYFYSSHCIQFEYKMRAVCEHTILALKRVPSRHIPGRTPVRHKMLWFAIVSTTICSGSLPNGRGLCVCCDEWHRPIVSYLVRLPNNWQATCRADELPDLNSCRTAGEPPRNQARK